MILSVKVRLCNCSGQLVHSLVFLLQGSIIWYWSMGGDALWLGIAVGLASHCLQSDLLQGQGLGTRDEHLSRIMAVLASLCCALVYLPVAQLCISSRNSNRHSSNFEWMYSVSVCILLCKQMAHSVV